jgi:hypothetical protein
MPFYINRTNPDFKTRSVRKKNTLDENDFDSQFQLKKSALNPDLNQIGVNFNKPNVTTFEDPGWNNYMEQFYYDSSIRLPLLPPNYGNVAKGFFNENLQEIWEIPLDKIENVSLKTSRTENLIQTPASIDNFRYLLEKFDNYNKPILSLAQGQTGACYANAISNWSVVQIALGILNGDGTEWLKTSFDTTETEENKVVKAIELSSKFRMSRPSVIYANSTLISTEFPGAASNTGLMYYQSGGTSSALLAYTNLIVPEQIFGMPLLYNTEDYWSILEGIEINALPNMSVNAEKGLTSSFTPKGELTLPFATGGEFQITKIIIYIVKSSFSGTAKCTFSIHQGVKSVFKQEINVIENQSSIHIIPENDFKINGGEKVKNLSYRVTGNFTAKTNQGRPYIKIFGFSNHKKLYEHEDLLLEEAYSKLTYGPPSQTISTWNNNYQIDKCKANILTLTGGENFNELEYLKIVDTYLSHKIPILLGFSVFKNYMNATKGFVDIKNPSETISLGGHENLIVGIIKIKDDNGSIIEENRKYLTAWKTETGNSVSDSNAPMAFFLSMNSWYSQSDPLGTSPLDINEDGTIKSDRIKSNIYWLPSNFISSEISSTSLITWPLVGNLQPSQTYDKTSLIDKPLSSKKLTLKGIVIDKMGVPIKDADVFIDSVGYGITKQKYNVLPTPSAKTDAAGKWTLQSPYYKSLHFFQELDEGRINYKIKKNDSMETNDSQLITDPDNINSYVGTGYSILTNPSDDDNIVVALTWDSFTSGNDDFDMTVSNEGIQCFSVEACTKLPGVNNNAENKTIIQPKTFTFDKNINQSPYYVFVTNLVTSAKTQLTKEDWTRHNVKITVTRGKTVTVLPVSDWNQEAERGYQSIGWRTYQSLTPTRHWQSIRINKDTTTGNLEFKKSNIFTTRTIY